MNVPFSQLRKWMWWKRTLNCIIHMPENIEASLEATIYMMTYTMLSA